MKKHTRKKDYSNNEFRGASGDVFIFRLLLNFSQAFKLLKLQLNSFVLLFLRRPITLHIFEEEYGKR